LRVRGPRRVKKFDTDALARNWYRRVIPEPPKKKERFSGQLREGKKERKPRKRSEKGKAGRVIYFLNQKKADPFVEASTREPSEERSQRPRFLDTCAKCSVKYDRTAEFPHASEVRARGIELWRSKGSAIYLPYDECVSCIRGRVKEKEDELEAALVEIQRRNAERLSQAPLPGLTTRTWAQLTSSERAERRRLEAAGGEGLSPVQVAGPSFTPGDEITPNVAISEPPPEPVKRLFKPHICMDNGVRTACGYKFPKMRCSQHPREVWEPST